MSQNMQKNIRPAQKHGSDMCMNDYAAVVQVYLISCQSIHREIPSANLKQCSNNTVTGGGGRVGQ